MVTQPIRILLQTTLPTLEDDWSIWRFSLLQDYLTSLTDDSGQPLCHVTARDREVDVTGSDPILSTLDRSQFDQLWLFALDTGDGLSPADCAGILTFHQQGGGILTTRDHQDMGISMLALEGLGVYHYFHTNNPDPDDDRCCVDDIYTIYISWPNYHSGRNGDYQRITAIDPIHPLLRQPKSTSGVIEFFPAHPHEGGIGVPAQAEGARVIAMGKSLVSDRPFNLVIAVDPPAISGQAPGRVVAQSTFHHFVDYNWDPERGCPSFVDEPAGDGMKREPRALEDIQTYVHNLVYWLSPVRD